MRALDRKLLRDLRRLWGQALTIALVVASGVAGFLTSLSAVDSLALARERFYTEGRFADLFAALERAPDSAAQRLREIPGVADVQTTVEHRVRIRVPGSPDPVTGQLIGFDARDPPRMNQLVVRSGRLPDPVTGAASAMPVLVSAGFAQARGLGPGSEVSALVNGRQRTLRIEGIALSPEYIFAGLGGLPDLRGFGVFWVDRNALAAAYDMAGAFNRVAVKLAPGANPQEVAERLGTFLAPYGSREAVTRDDQTSHAMLDNEIKEQRIFGSLLPAIFLGVAAFLLNVVVARLVATQREQIAALKALGYPNRTIAAHYLKLVTLIVVLGVGIGVAAGYLLGRMLTGLYSEFFFFPHFAYRLAPALVLSAAGIAAATGVLATLSAIHATVRLAPAEAMRPPSPGQYRRTLLERMGITRLALSARMVLRNVERRPVRAAVSVLGIAAAVAIVVLGNFFRDAIGVITDTQTNLVLRADVVVWTEEPVAASTAASLARLPGVLETEPGRDIPVRLRHGHRSERANLQGYERVASLRRIIDIGGRETRVSGEGVVLTDRLADKLGLRPGDQVVAETLDGRRRVLVLPVDATVREMIGLNAYMERSALDRALGDGDLASQFSLAVERGREGELLETLGQIPKVAGAFSKATFRRNMEEISARNVRIMSTLLTAFACVIAVGVVYNHARIALAERTWELASLRVLGFTRGEVSALLLGELALAIALALPLGMVLGAGLAQLLTQLMQSDQFRFPVVIHASSYALAAVVILLAGAGSAAIVRRRIDRLDMVAALKTRE